MLKAFVELDETLATKAEKAGHIRIGWVSCRIKRRKMVTWCFRCHGFGYIAANCGVPDRGNICWKCGESDHRAADCRNRPKCCLCIEGKEESDHARALETARPTTGRRSGKDNGDHHLGIPIEEQYCPGSARPSCSGVRRATPYHL